MRGRTTGAVLAAAGILLVSGCGSGISVNHDYDRAYDFTGLTTYSWMPVRVSVQISELEVKRLLGAFDREFERMGFRKVAKDGDFEINVHGSTQQKVDVTDWGYSRGYWGGRDVSVTSYEQGTLIMDFIDGESQEMFWRGTATAIVEPKASVAQQERQFETLARQMLAKFPPTK